jgi:hypothetical protein
MSDLSRLNQLREQRAAAKAALEASRERVRALRDNLRGLLVRVVKGRKLAKGTEFVVQQHGEGQYGEWVRTPEGLFIDRRNVEPIDPKWIAADAARDAAFADVERIEESIRAVEAAIIAAAGIDIAHPVRKVEYRQEAWRDVSVYEYACNPDADDELVRIAVQLADAPQSSWGQLRWSCGSNVTSRPAPDRVLVHSSVGLCD